MKKVFEHDRFIETLLIIYLFVGMMSYPVFKYARYGISLFIQIYVVLRSNLLSRPVKELKITLVSYVLILFIGIGFIFLQVNARDGVERILPLVSIFGLSILYVYRDKIRTERVLSGVFFLYCALAFVILGDIVIQKWFGIGIWKPIQYLGARYSGPFSDPNYMGVLYAFLLILFLFGKKRLRLYRYFPRVIAYSAVIIVSGSWSAIILCLGVIVFHAVFRIKHLFVKQIVFMLLYLSVSFLVYYNAEGAKTAFVGFFGKILPYDNSELTVKFNSLLIRIETQVKAIGMGSDRIFGFGPRTILKYFTHDTHNSYAAIFFELGIFGVLLLLVNMPLKSNSRLVDAASTFVILSSFFLDIHYTIIYTFFLILTATVGDDGRSAQRQKANVGIPANTGKKTQINRERQYE